MRRSALLLLLLGWAPRGDAAGDPSLPALTTLHRESPYLPEPLCSPSHPCGACQGRCSDDPDCKEHHVCMHRDALEPVPGCRSGGSGDRYGYNYCSKISDPERFGLEQVYKSASGSTWHNNEGWLNASRPHCTWFGVTCTS